MKETNKHILENALKQLPVFKADSETWERIEYKLDKAEQEINYDALQQSIGNLNRFKAEDKIWDKIENGLSDKIKTGKRLLLLKVAASVIIAVGLSIGINKLVSKSNQKEFITYSQEVVVKINTDDYSIELEKEVNDLIARQCRTQPEACTNPVFTELSKEYSDLEKALEQIKLHAKNSSDDSEANKYILLIQKEKVELSKKMLHFLSIIDEG